MTFPLNSTHTLSTGKKSEISRECDFAAFPEMVKEVEMALYDTAAYVDFL